MLGKEHLKEEIQQSHFRIVNSISSSLVGLIYHITSLRYTDIDDLKRYRNAIVNKKERTFDCLVGQKTRVTTLRGWSNG